MGLLEIDREGGLAQPQYTPPELLGEHLSMPNARIIVVTASYCFFAHLAQNVERSKTYKLSFVDHSVAQLVEIQVHTKFNDYLRRVSTRVSAEVANSNSP